MIAKYKFRKTKKFDKQMLKLDRHVRSKIASYIEDVLGQLTSPRLLGKALTGDKNGLWRYRIGDYKLICRIEDEVVTVIMLSVAHRKDVYE
jgi:mRNA interferase RelE/StbE